MTFNKHLQGLRAVAVMFVLLAHADLRFFSGGFVGVDIFFVLGRDCTSVVHAHMYRRALHQTVLGEVVELCANNA